MKLIEILDIELDNIRISEAVERSVRAMEASGGEYVLLLDSQQLLQCRKSRMLMGMISRAFLVLPADKGIFAAARILGLPLSHKMSALDYSSALMARVSDNGGSVFILTGKSGIAQRASDDLQRRFPGVSVVGAQHTGACDEEELVDMINASRPDLLILCMDFYEQMRLINSLSAKAETGLVLGLGRAMDQYTAKRGSSSPIKRLSEEPGRELKEARIVLAALKKRIFG